MDDQIIMFSAPWCRPCVTMKPVVNEVITNYPIKLINVNVDEETTLAVKYNVRQIPTLLFLKNDQEIDRLIGSQTSQTIKDFIASKI